MRLGVLREDHRRVGREIAHRGVLRRFDDESRRIKRRKAPRSCYLAKDLGDAFVEDLKDVHISRAARICRGSLRF